MATTKARRIGVVLSPTPGAWDGKSTAAPIVWKEERYYMLYQGWSNGSGPRILGLAESEDGLQWTKYKKNPVAKPSIGTWDRNGFECGSLLKLDSEYWLFYTGFGADGKSLYLLSHKGGTLHVEIDPAGLDQWHALHEGKAGENILWTYSTSEGFDRIRLRFMPVKEARASAWLVLGK